MNNDNRRKKLNEIKGILSCSDTLRSLGHFPRPLSVALKAAYAPITILRNENGVADGLRMRRRGGAYFHYFEVVISTRCTLRCRYCANLMQYYKEPYDVPLQLIENSFDRLMSLCDWVDMVRAIGGEPFLCRNLADVLEMLLRYPQVKCVGIPTNGTVPLRDERLLRVLQNKRIIIDVSDYGYGEVDAFCHILQNNGISFLIHKEKDWVNYGNVEKRNRSNRQLQEQFDGCGNTCRSFLNGMLFYCPRSGHGNDLGLIPARPGEYLDFTDSAPPVSRRELLEFYYRAEPIEACDHCDYGLEHPEIIPAGRDQLKKPVEYL